MSNHKLRVYDKVVDLIASPENPTPLVRVRNFELSDKFKLYLKLEWFNPFGSIKDRTAFYLLKGLQEKGKLKGKELVEPTSGNTGIALTAIANMLGVRTTITIPSAVPEENKTLLRLLGAEVWPTPDDLCPIEHPKDGAIALAKSMVEGEAYEGKYVMPNQYENPDNVKAHYETTGPEIWNQTEGKVTHFFAGYGTCGTITGTAKFLKEKNRDIKVIAIEPMKNHKLAGLKSFAEANVPIILDRSFIDETIIVSDEDAYNTAIKLARKESLLVGPSTGAIVYAALKYAEGKEGIAAAISPDNAFKYTSFFNEWVKNDGVPNV